MKRFVIVVLVMFLLLVAAPWGIGQLAEKRVNDGLDKVVEQAPYLTIVERKWTSGWFRSGQEVTFEVFGAWIDAMNPKKVLAAETEGVESEVEPEAAPEPAKPIRFTVHNEILHGPVLWPASLGLARVNTKLVLSDEVRKELMKFFGTDEPLRVSSRVGFFGGGSTRFFGEGRTVEIKEALQGPENSAEFVQQDGVLTYDDFELKIGYSGDLDEIDMDGSWSKLEYTDKNTRERLLVSGMSLEGDGERIVGDIYDTDFEFEIDEMLFVGTDKMETTVEHVHYVVETDHEDGFMDFSARFGSGKVSNQALEELQLQLQEIHYDFTVRRLHVDTMQRLLEALKASYSKPVTTVADVEAAVLSPMKEYGVALLKYNPEFAIDRIGIVTAHGEGMFKGVLRLPGVTEADLAGGALTLVDKLEAEFTVEVAQKLLEKIPNGATGAGLAVDQGFARRDGEKLVSRIEFKLGELTVNGKPLPIPGLGAAPSQDGLPQEEPTLPEE
jgi:uncharacterized protein YdgA (DUF945 family)